jgi:hypothetical protein
MLLIDGRVLIVISRILDQAEHVIGFISDWLELDSPIEGVRYDSEMAGAAILPMQWRH